MRSHLAPAEPAPPPDARARLLQAAEDIFAAKVAGTAPRAVAARAGTDLAAVNHHFGGKENFRGVARRRLWPLARAEARTPAPPPPRSSRPSSTPTCPPAPTPS